MTKTCIKCKTIKPFSEFYTSTCNSDGYRGTCIKCFNTPKFDWSKLSEKDKNAYLTNNTKTCNQCKTTKTFKNFRLDKQSQDGLTKTCKECSKQKEKKFDWSALSSEQISSYLSENSKICKGCKKNKNFSAFNRDNGKIDGLVAFCKSCRKVKTKNFYKNNREDILKREYERRKTPQFKEWKVKYDRGYYEKNKEKIADYSKQYRAKPENKEKRRKNTRKRRKMMPAGIYEIVNKKNNVVYVGCSTMIPQRWKEHKRTLKKNTHDNRYLQQDYNKHGIESFEFNIIKQFPKDTSFKELEKEETRLILENHNKGVPMYNLSIKISSIEKTS